MSTEDNTSPPNLPIEVDIVDEPDGQEGENTNTGTDSSRSNDASIDTKAATLSQSNNPVSQESVSKSVPSQDGTLKSEGNSSQKSKKRKFNDECEDEGKLCSICLDDWTSTGDHRISALKCGHLFGHRCILRWVSVNKTCPTCKLLASRHDLRFIYANKLIAVDNTEITILQKQLELVAKEKNRIQIDLTKAVCKQHLLCEQLDTYKKKIKYLTKEVSTKRQNACDLTIIKNVQIGCRDSLMICRQGSCRVMAVDPLTKRFVISLKSPVNVFTGFGVRQYCTRDFSVITYIPLHREPIRDIKFNPRNSWQLSVSLDKVAKVIDISTNEQVCSYTGNNMLWSCCWDANDSNFFYIGEQQGTVVKLDTRKMSTPLEMHEFLGDMSPVVSIVSMASGIGKAMPLGGFAACKLNSVWAFENSHNNETIRHLIPIDGPFASMSFNGEDDQMLVSTRPNSREPKARHIVCNLVKSEGNVLRPNILHTFYGGRLQKQLSRTCFVRNMANRHSYVAAQQDSSIVLWSINSGGAFSTLKRTTPAIDLMPVNNVDGSHILALSEEKVDIYKFLDD